MLDQKPFARLRSAVTFYAIAYRRIKKEGRSKKSVKLDIYFSVQMPAYLLL